MSGCECISDLLSHTLLMVNIAPAQITNALGYTQNILTLFESVGLSANETTAPGRSFRNL